MSTKRGVTFSRSRLFVLAAPAAAAVAAFVAHGTAQLGDFAVSGHQGAPFAGRYLAASQEAEDRGQPV